jgi:hypothetical protein
VRAALLALLLLPSLCRATAFEQLQAAAESADAAARSADGSREAPAAPAPVDARKRRFGCQGFLSCGAGVITAPVVLPVTGFKTGLVLGKIATAPSGKAAHVAGAAGGATLGTIAGIILVPVVMVVGLFLAFANLFSGRLH